MKLTIAAVGRLKAGPEKLLADDYLKRAEGMGRKAGISAIRVQDFSESQASSAAARMAEEARILASAVPPRSFSIVLDERGKAVASEAFAGLMQRQLDHGTSYMTFVVGGPDGHAPETRERADLLLSDMERFDELVFHPDRPVQFVFAGKAHPADAPGKELLRCVASVDADPR